MSGYDLSLPDEVLRRIEYKAYCLPSYERSSINEISSMLQNGGYLDCETVHEHIRYLQDLIERLDKVVHTQASIGENSPRLTKQVRDFKILMGQLVALESQLPSRYSVA